LEQEKKWKVLPKTRPEKETINGAPVRYCISILSIVIPWYKKKENGRLKEEIFVNKTVSM